MVRVASSATSASVGGVSTRGKRLTACRRATLSLTSQPPSALVFVECNHASPLSFARTQLTLTPLIARQHHLTRKPFENTIERAVSQLDYAGMVYGAEGNRCLTSDTWATRMGAMTVPFHLPASLENCKKPDEMAYSLLEDEHLTR